MAERGQILCRPCQLTITPVSSHISWVTDKKYITVYARGAYARPLRELILSKQQRRITVSEQLGTLLLHDKTIHDSIKQADYLIPVPLHWSRYAWRGYNQAAVLARALSRQLGTPVIQPFYRARKTRPQSQLNKKERQANTAGIFKIKPWFYYYFKKRLSGKKLVIIDDLFTTGSTVNALVQVLLKADPQDVSVVVVARKV